jgi:hypothetical protein
MVIISPSDNTKHWFMQILKLSKSSYCTLQPINSESDVQDPPVSAEVVETEFVLLRWTWPHMSAH